MKRRGFQLLLAVLAMCLVTSSVFAQGGGASSTGSINGKVSDSSGAVLPGVTVNATSPSAMGVQNTVTDAAGNYRFPALPPGTYTLTFELAGFNTLKRENIQLSLGFTATVNVDLAVASLTESVTVTGDSPVIDTTNTRVQQNFKLEALQETPNSRDIWSLLAVTPSVQMQRIDVGGNRAGTQTAYAAYGYSGQNRVLVEGINTDGRHQRRRLLRGLRLVRRSVPRHRRPGRRDADPWRAEPDARQVGRQQVHRRVLQ